MYPITLYNAWWKLCPFVIVLSGYCLFKEKLKSGGWLEKAPVSKNGPWPGICLVFICKSGIYTVPERGHVCQRQKDRPCWRTEKKPLLFISFEASEMIKEALLDARLLKVLSTWTSLLFPSLFLYLYLISCFIFCLFMGFWPFFARTVAKNQDTNPVSTTGFPDPLQ